MPNPAPVQEGSSGTPIQPTFNVIPQFLGFGIEDGTAVADIFFYQVRTIFKIRSQF
jgi:hypothetical protein